MKQALAVHGDSFRVRVKKDFTRYKGLYLMALPVIIYYLVFHYGPLYGATIAFKDFIPSAGIMGSPWAGFKHFVSFFNSYYFTRVLKNTLFISLYSILFSFPAPIILALFMNEIKNRVFKKTVQTVSYLPHFISIMVVCGMLVDFCSTYGVFNDIIAFFGGERENLLVQPELFRTIYIGSEVWQSTGWNSIIYLAALAGIDPTLYEAASIDGAGRARQMWSITLPSLKPTIVTLLILRLGQVMNVGFEKIILLYTPTTYETADVISSFIYRKGLLEFDYSYASAVGLFNSVINFIFLIAANSISKRLDDNNLW